MFYAEKLIIFEKLLIFNNIFNSIIIRRSYNATKIDNFDVSSRCSEADSDEISKSTNSDVSSSIYLKLYAISYRGISKNLILDNILFINRDIFLTNFKVRDVKIKTLKEVKDRNIKRRLRLYRNST